MSESGGYLQGWWVPGICFLRRITKHIRSKLISFFLSYYFEVFYLQRGWNFRMTWILSFLPGVSWTVYRRSIVWFILNDRPASHLVVVKNAFFVFKSNSLVNLMHVAAGTSCCSPKGIMIGVGMTTRWLVGPKSIFERFEGSKGRYAFRGVCCVATLVVADYWWLHYISCFVDDYRCLLYTSDAADE